MAVDGAVSAEEQDDVGLVGNCRHADAPGGVVRRGVLKGLEVVRGTFQAEDGGGAHLREGSRNRGGEVWAKLRKRSDEIVILSEARDPMPAAAVSGDAGSSLLWRRC